MSDIHDEVIAQIYTAYNEALHSRQKSEILIAGVKQILLRLNMYVNNPEKFRERSRNALVALENYLNRFYHQDTEFREQLMYEAKAYVLELGGNIEV